MNLDVHDDGFAQRHGIIQKPIIFFLLCFFTFGLYSIWWQYRTWRFLKEKDQLNVYPVARAIFSLFFIHSLLGKINNEAKDKGHPGVHSDAYAALYIVTAIVGRVVDKLPEPTNMFTLLIPAYVFLIPAVKQLNTYWEEEAPHSVSRTVNTSDIVVLVFGVFFFLLAILGLLIDEPTP